MGENEALAMNEFGSISFPSLLKSWHDVGGVSLMFELMRRVRAHA